VSDGIAGKLLEIGPSSSPGAPRCAATPRPLFDPDTGPADLACLTSTSYRANLRRPLEAPGTISWRSGRPKAKPHHPPSAAPAPDLGRVERVAGRFAQPGRAWWVAAVDNAGVLAAVTPGTRTGSTAGV